MPLEGRIPGPKTGIEVFVPGRQGIRAMRELNPACGSADLLLGRSYGTSTAEENRAFVIFRVAKFGSGTRIEDAQRKRRGRRAIDTRRPLRFG